MQSAQLSDRNPSLVARSANNERSAYRRPLRIATGLTLAASILLLWFGFLASGLFFYRWGSHSLLTAPLLAGMICWLYVGLFIVAHDCMHGSLIPARPLYNRVVGQLFLSLYAAFSYDDLRRQHFLHHRYPGTVEDPDFDERLPHSAPRWYLGFLIRYFSMRQLVVMGLATMLLLSIGEVSYANLLAFWALPAILSSVQLFYFGIYLPHRSSSQPFSDRHRTRDSGYGWWRSLLTCYHFGHHQVHHEHPQIPWWGLPTADAEKRNLRVPGGVLENVG